MKYLLTKSDKKTACIKDGCKLKDFLTCYYSGNGSCIVWEKAQDHMSRKGMLEWLQGYCENDDHPAYYADCSRYECCDCMSELEEELK